jgi:RNA polymerase sigma-70 factor (ECF subfamily)
MSALSTSRHNPGLWGNLSLAHNVALERFLAGIERRAYRMAVLATGAREDALDVVQESMFKLARRYGQRGEAEWGPLFQRILQTTIRDWYRRRAVRERFRVWLGGREEDTCQVASWENAPAPDHIEPSREVAQQQSLAQLEQALATLPLRQRQAVLLRVWEGLDVAQTAEAMGCSQGSVKTHYSRAVHTLRELLGEHWP